MLRNTLKTAWRALRRRPSLTALNVVGLGASLGVALLVLLFLRGQWQLDRFHSDAGQIHRITAMHDGTHYATSPRPLAEALRTADVVGVDAVTRLDRVGETFLTRGDSSLSVKAFRADATLWDVFDGFRFQSGRQQDALQAPQTAVVTAATARAMFGTRNPVGETVKLENETAYTVVGVLATPPGPTHLDADVFLASQAPEASGAPQTWERIYGQWTYVRLADGTSPGALQAAAEALFQQNARPQIRDDYRFAVAALGEVRFGPSYSNEISPRVQLPVWMYLVLGVLASVGVVAAGFNYVNLTIAQSLRRAKEIGVRKTLGSGRAALMGQFIGEAVLTALCAGGVATVLFFTLAPSFNGLFVFNLMEITAVNPTSLFDPSALLLVLGVCAVTGFLAGVYPAFVLSSFRPSQALGGEAKTKRNARLRSALIGLQVAFTVVLLVTAVTLLRQTNYMAASDHTLRTERLVSVQLKDVPYEDFRQKVAALPAVSDVSAINNLMLGPSNYRGQEVRSPRTESGIQTTYYAVDTSFVANMGLRFRRALPSWNVPFAAEEGVILNEAAMAAYGYDAPDDVLGVSLTLGDPSLSTETRTVVGVVENFEYTGIAEVYTAGFAANDAPLMLRPDSEMYEHALVRARTDDVAGLRVDLETLWTERLDTAHPFQARLYSDVTRMRYGPLEDASLMTACVAGLAILIALLGLLSLAAHHVQSRRKEVGVRKALGATVREVMVTLSKGFAALVAGAALVAAPLAWLLNRWWLGFFSDGVTVHLGILAACVIGLVALSLFVIGSQAIQVALLNPATTLQDE